MATTRLGRQVSVLGRFSIAPEDRLAAAARRALAYLAVKGPVVQRGLMSMELWPAMPDTRARANLRRALWQLPTGWVTSNGWEVRLEAETDYGEARQITGRAMRGAVLDAGEIDLLTRDLLPGWYDEWLHAEQDAFHLERIQVLETVSRQAAALNQHMLATRAGLAAVCAEPLRQSAVVALIEAHVAEGNRYEAVRRYEHYCDLLRAELGLEPPAELTALVTRMGTGSSSGVELRRQ